MYKKLILLALYTMFCVAVARASDPIVTDSTTVSSVDSTAKSTTTVYSPPPSAIAPTINSSNSDVCTVTYSGAVQTQILGLSAGASVRDMNCERLKNAKTMFDMGMKVAAVSVMCQDERVFDAMMNAGTPCPYDGKIGEEAKAGWELDRAMKEQEKEESDGQFEKILKDETTLGIGATLGLLLILL